MYLPDDPKDRYCQECNAPYDYKPGAAFIVRGKVICRRCACEHAAYMRPGWEREVAWAEITRTSYAWLPQTQEA